jgi:hypothetical protein
MACFFSANVPKIRRIHALAPVFPEMTLFPRPQRQLDLSSASLQVVGAACCEARRRTGFEFEKHSRGQRPAVSLSYLLSIARPR